MNALVGYDPDQRKRLQELSQGFDFEGEFTGNDGGLTPDGLEQLLVQEDAMKAKFLKENQALDASVPPGALDAADVTNAEVEAPIPDLATVNPIEDQSEVFGPIYPGSPIEQGDLAGLDPLVQQQVTPPGQAEAVAKVLSQTPPPTASAPPGLGPREDFDELESGIPLDPVDDRSNALKLVDLIPEVLGTGTNKVLDAVTRAGNLLANQFESPSNHDAKNATRAYAIDAIRPSAEEKQVSRIELPSAPKLPSTSAESQDEAQGIVREAISGAGDAVSNVVDKGKEVVSNIGDDISRAVTPKTTTSISEDLPPEALIPTKFGDQRSNAEVAKDQLRQVEDDRAAALRLAQHSKWNNNVPGDIIPEKRPEGFSAGEVSLDNATKDAFLRTLGVLDKDGSLATVAQVSALLNPNNEMKDSPKLRNELLKRIEDLRDAEKAEELPEGSSRGKF